MSCLKENEFMIFKSTEKSTVTAMFEVQFKVGGAMCLVLMLGLNEAMDQLPVRSSVHCYRHVLRMESVYVLGKGIRVWFWRWKEDRV